MIKRIVSRVIQYVVVLMVISTFTFLLMHFIPGSPLAKVLHLEVTNVSQEQIEKTATSLGLNESLFQQWLTWMSQVVRFDFGNSFVTGEPVISELAYYIQPTLLIAVLTVATVCLFSVPVGIIAALFEHRFADRLIRIITTLLVSLPVFFIGMILLYIFSFKLHLLTVQESSSYSVMHIILAVIALSIGMSAYYVRLIRSNIIELYQSKEVRASRIRGMSEHYILFNDILIPALLPAVSVIGMSAGSLIAGSVVIESLFNIPGLGYYLLESIRARDYPVVQGAVLLISVIVILSNALADFVIYLMNPRLRLMKQPVFKSQKSIENPL